MPAPPTFADAVRQIAADPAAKFIAGGTNLIDLMKEDVERPSRLIDISRLPLKSVEDDAGRRIADRRAGAEFRPRLSPAGGRALSDAGQRDPGRRLGAIAQHGIDRRQSPAAHPLRLFLRHRDAVQQTRARQRLLGDRRPQPQARHPRHQRGLHRDPSLRHVRGAGGARGESPRCRPAGARSIAFADFHRLPGDDTAARQQSAIGRNHHRGRTPAPRLRRALHLPEDPRPAVLCLRPGVRRRGAGGRRRHRQGGAPGAWRRRAQAVARSERRGGAARPDRRPRRLRARPRMSCCAAPRLSPTTHSRSIWRAAPSSAP